MEEIGEKGALHQEVPLRLHAQICYRSGLPSLSLCLYSTLFIYFFFSFFFVGPHTHTYTQDKDIAIRFVWEVCLGYQAAR